MRIKVDGVTYNVIETGKNEVTVEEVSTKAKAGNAQKVWLWVYFKDADEAKKAFKYTKRLENTGSGGGDGLGDASFETSLATAKAVVAKIKASGAKVWCRINDLDGEEIWADKGLKSLFKRR